MTTILVLTSNPGFGELIGQVLQETGRYDIELAGTPQEGVDLTHQHQPTLCVLDCDLEQTALSQLVNEMRDAAPDMLFVMIPSDKSGDTMEIEQMDVDGYLSKPFYLPDLITTVEEVLESSALLVKKRVPTKPLGEIRKAHGVDAKPKSPAPEWLKNVNVAAQHLTRLSLESASQAALITRGLETWAYAGELPQPAVDELAQTVSHYFVDGGNTDLARFVRLDAMGADYMLYATGLGGEFVLSLVFDAETPFSKIRAHANQLATALASTPPEDILEDSAQMLVEEDDAELQLPIEPLWESIPPPIPQDWLPEKGSAQQREEFMDDLINDRSAKGDADPMLNPFTRESSSPQRLRPDRVPEKFGVALEEDMDGAPAEELQSLPDYLAETMLSRSLTDAVDQEHYAETMLSQSLKAEEDLQEKPVYALEPASQSMINLVYACVLIPRMPYHYLTGDLGSRLSEWVTQFSLAFGWRLEQLSIRPDYLQWLVNVPEKTSPGYLMRIMRQHTSRRIFAEFPRLAEENPSGDFWAPGYLIMSSSNPPPPHLVSDFIKDTRARQGAGSNE